MRFQLVIAEGNEAGREFEFAQPEVVVGRTPECDVVLYDAGVSRKHARLFQEPGQVLIEDLGSSNGTQVNGAQVKRAPLSDGDRITLGPVVFRFVATTQAGELDAPETGKHTILEESTRIVSTEDLERRRKGAALAPRGASPADLQQLTRRSTRVHKEAAALDLSPDQAFEDLPTGPRSAAPARATSSKLKAAERARLRREHSAAGASLRIFWAEAGAGVKNLLLGLLALVGLGFFGLLYYVLIARPPPARQLPPEPSVLTGARLESSFGLGEGVDYERADQKFFDFQYNAPAKAVVLLHFQARDISQGEVVVSVNGVDIGAVPPDVLGGNEREHELLVPPNVLKKGERNQLAFDNTQNPPRAETWRVWNLRLEVSHLPQLPKDQLLRDANLAFQRGLQNLERRDVGARNRYEAWKDFRSAWLMLEAHDEPRPELYSLSRDKVREAQLELDRTCAKLLLEANASFNQKQFEAARLTLEHVREYFPGTDQPCPYIAEEKRELYGL